MNKLRIFSTKSPFNICKQRGVFCQNIISDSLSCLMFWEKKTIDRQFTLISRDTFDAVLFMYHEIRDFMFLMRIAFMLCSWK